MSSLEDKYNRDIDARHDSTPERLEARSLLAPRIPLLLPNGIHPSSLYDGVEQVGRMPSAEELKNIELRLQERRLQDVLAHWQHEDRRIPEVPMDELFPRQQELIKMIKSLRTAEGQFNEILEVIYADMLERSHAFGRVIRTNDATDILRGTDFFVLVEEAENSTGTWVALDLTTSAKQKGYDEKMRKEGSFVSPILPYERRRRVGLPGEPPRIESKLLVQFHNYYTLKRYYELLKRESYFHPLVEREYWVKLPTGQWALALGEPPKGLDDSRLYCSPESESLTDAEALQLFQKAIDEAPAMEQRLERGTNGETYPPIVKRRAQSVAQISQDVVNFTTAPGGQARGGASGSRARRS